MRAATLAHYRREALRARVANLQQMVRDCAPPLLVEYCDYMHERQQAQGAGWSRDVTACTLANIRMRQSAALSR